MQKLTKSYETYPPKCGNSASFGPFKNYIALLFWSLKLFQNFTIFSRYKTRDLPLFYKTLRQIANLLSINFIFLWAVSNQHNTVNSKKATMWKDFWPYRGTLVYSLVTRCTEAILKHCHKILFGFYLLKCINQLGQFLTVQFGRYIFGILSGDLLLV